ncbi:MAG: two-component system LytT family sensor kinase [Paraglaciecola sp.]|jgi:two-component system LytT family sensor kinase
MTAVSQNSFRAKTYDLVTKRWVYHSFFWSVLLVFLTVIEVMGSHFGFFFIFSNNLIRLFIFALIVYFNLFYLIPNYLTKKEFLRYLALLALSVIIITPLESFILYLKFWDMPEAQATLVQDLNWSFIPNFFVAGSATIFKIITDWVRHLREKQELETQTMQSELRFLKSQINPHFLFNTLNNLYALTLKKSEKAPEIVIKLSEMMRYMLYECNEKQVLLSKEVHYLRNYLDLEALRQGKGVEINFNVQGHISNQTIAPLMFIPFLENSFKHGVNHTISKGFVNIFLNVEDNQVHLFIENSKPETLPKPSRRKSGGIGLVNVRRRLQLMYFEKYELNIENTPNTYSVNLELDLN